MSENLYLRYKGIVPENDSLVDLTDLGKSLIGFDKAVTKLIKVVRLKGDISLKATACREGSLIVDIIIDTYNYIQAQPFEDFNAYLDFLKIVNEELYNNAQDVINSLDEAHKDINTFFQNHPFDLTLLALAIPTLFGYLKKFKNKKAIAKEEDISRHMAERLHNLIQQHSFKELLDPIVNNKVSTIEISNERSFPIEKSTEINETNFQEYLGDDDQILPLLKNGDMASLDGQVVALKAGARKERLTFKYEFQGKKYDIELLPPDKTTTKPYKDFYKEDVLLEAEVIRESMYKKPIKNKKAY